MSFLLKILDGPNKGAEIALPEGVAVTLGKGDDCDIVLADATLPDAPVSLAAAPDGVTLDGAPLESLHVKTIGATSFAVGPDGAPWGELAWPEKEESGGEVVGQSGGEEATHPPSPPTAQPPNHQTTQPPNQKRHGRRLGCLVLLLLLVLVAIAMSRNPTFRHRARSRLARLGTTSSATVSNGDACSVPEASALGLRALASRYGLAVDEGDGGSVKVSGNFATRCERLAATAEFYAAQPGVDLDLSDDESLRTAAEDTLAMLSEADLRVAAATNRVLALTGTARDIRRTLEALAADLPKLRDVDVANVNISRGGAEIAENGRETLDERRGDGGSSSLVSRLAPPKAAPTLPVCGILTTPYPCLVLKNGARVMEGAPLGDGVVLKIEADSVTITNSAGRFTWKP